MQDGGRHTPSPRRGLGAIKLAALISGASHARRWPTYAVPVPGTWSQGCEPVPQVRGMAHVDPARYCIEAEFDLSIINPQGEHVAGCEAFIDYENGVAEIERVCTHSGYRRRGLAKAVIESCFHRLRSHGIYTAYITGWNEATNNLYGKLGHSKEVERSCYELIRADLTPRPASAPCAARTAPAPPGS